MRICGIEVLPGEKKQTNLTVLPGIELPIWVACGTESGPTLVITAGVHGCEYVGVQTLPDFYKKIHPADFRGQLVVVPLANPTGFYHGEKQIVPEDGKNLNREFPGKVDGTASQRIAYAIEMEIYPHADFLIDLHGGDINEDLTPLVFFPIVGEEAVITKARNAAMHLPVAYRVRSTANNGLYSYGVKCGVPALLLEIGARGIWTPEQVALCNESLVQLMGYLQMTDPVKPNDTQRESVREVYETAEATGLWYPYVTIGQSVQQGELLGELKSLGGELLHAYTAQTDAVIWYYTVTLGASKGDPLMAYGTFA